ncbi:MAG: TIGR01459 family HAD-type hydrolase [Acetobacteraceae bacterium]
MADWRDEPGVAALLPGADAFLVDQFGTLHDGARPYPGALAALRLLRRDGARVALLSNSGKRSAANEARLQPAWLPPDSYAAFLSSGEAAWHVLRARREAGLRACLLLSRDGDEEAIAGTGLRRVMRAAEAELVLIAGSEAERIGLAAYERLLAPAAERGIPAICSNPDRLMLVNGGTAPGAGQIAALYERLGGPVEWIGKPHLPIYRHALALLGDPAPSRVWGVGDSVEHDIAGARGAGCRAALIANGIATGLDGAALAGRAGASRHRAGCAAACISTVSGVAPAAGNR